MWQACAQSTMSSDVDWRRPPPPPKSHYVRGVYRIIYMVPPMKKLIFLSSHVARVARREDEFEFGEMKQRSSTSLYPRRLEMTSRHCRAYHRKCPLYILHVTGGMQLKVKCYDICYSKQRNRLAGNVRRLTDRCRSGNIWHLMTYASDICGSYCRPTAYKVHIWCLYTHEKLCLTTMYRR